MYICNAFSLQMISSLHAGKINFLELDKVEFKDGMVTLFICGDAVKETQYLSAVGHADTAAVLGLPCQRINVALNAGDEILVCQLQGGRLPEGCTTLPEGFHFKWYWLRIGGAL